MHLVNTGRNSPEAKTKHRQQTHKNSIGSAEHRTNEKLPLQIDTH